MGLEISEAMYAGLSKMDSTILQEAATDAEKFNDLLQRLLDLFQPVRLMLMDLSTVS